MMYQGAINLTRSMASVFRSITNIEMCVCVYVQMTGIKDWKMKEM